MLTLEQTDSVFETNANSSGVHEFRLVKKGVIPSGKNIYIYQRTCTEEKLVGHIVGFEVVIPKVVKAGTVYKFPGGLEKTISEDTEVYPGTSSFGKSAWFFPTLHSAEQKFELLTALPIEIPETEDEPEEVGETVPKGRGRPKVDRPPLTLITGEFSATELATKNNVEYCVASQFIKEQVALGKFKVGRKERRAARGKETQLYIN
jgi:hypothetical protein